jgi:hypothetical protein
VNQGGQEGGGQQGGGQHKPGQQEQEPNRRGGQQGDGDRARWRSARRATLDELTKDPPEATWGGFPAFQADNNRVHNVPK